MSSQKMNHPNGKKRSATKKTKRAPSLLRRRHATVYPSSLRPLGLMSVRMLVRRSLPPGHERCQIPRILLVPIEDGVEAALGAAVVARHARCGDAGPLLRVAVPGLAFSSRLAAFDADAALDGVGGVAGGAVVEGVGVARAGAGLEEGVRGGAGETPGVRVHVAFVVSRRLLAVAPDRVGADVALVTCAFHGTFPTAFGGRVVEIDAAA